MKLVYWRPTLLIIDKLIFICRLDAGFSVKPTSLRVLLPVRNDKSVTFNNLTSY